MHVNRRKYLTVLDRAIIGALLLLALLLLGMQFANPDRPTIAARITAPR